MDSKDLSIVSMIPARMGSSRFPGKPLAPILGLPMIEHVYRRTAMCSMLQAVYVATCDDEIKEAVQGFGGRVIMTSSSHQRASDRIAEAAEGMDVDIIVMVQGDEPMTYPEMIENAVGPMLKDPEIQCVNLTKRITTMEELQDPNTIKVVLDAENNALYFSRQPIPTYTNSGPEEIPMYKQVCIMPFRTEALHLFSELEPTPLEKAESIDMLRFLEHGYNVRMIETDFDTHAVDTPEDLMNLEKLMAKDPLVQRYLK